MGTEDKTKESDEDRIARLVDERVAARLKDDKMDDGEKRLRAIVREESTSVLGEFFEKIADAEEEEENENESAGNNDGGNGKTSLSEVLAGFLK